MINKKQLIRIIKAFIISLAILITAVLGVMEVIGNGSEQKGVYLTHRCNNDHIWVKYIHVHDDNLHFFRCDMCLTVIQVDGFKIVKEDTSQKRKPINVWLQ